MGSTGSDWFDSIWQGHRFFQKDSDASDSQRLPFAQTAAYETSLQIDPLRPPRKGPVARSQQILQEFFFFLIFQEQREGTSILLVFPFQALELSHQTWATLRPSSMLNGFLQGSLYFFPFNLLGARNSMLAAVAFLTPASWISIGQVFPNIHTYVRTDRQADRQTEGDRQAESDKQTNRPTDSEDRTETDRQTETDRDRQTETDRDRQRQTETDRDRQRQAETGRDRQAETETDKHTDRPTDRQPEKTERQEGRQTDKQRQTGIDRD